MLTLPSFVRSWQRSATFLLRLHSRATMILFEFALTRHPMALLVSPFALYIAFCIFDN
jgi:hypothetical protein